MHTSENNSPSMTFFWTEWQCENFSASHGSDASATCPTLQALLHHPTPSATHTRYELCEQHGTHHDTETNDINRAQTLQTKANFGVQWPAWQLCRGINANLSKQLDNKIWADNQEIEEIKRTKKSQKKELPKNHFYWSTYETDIFYWSIKITIFFLLINKTNLK